MPLAKDIADNPDAVTRFVLVSRPGPVGPATGADKSTMVLFMRDDHPGALLRSWNSSPAAVSTCAESSLARPRRALVTTVSALMRRGISTTPAWLRR